jgi:hypothetical protein
MKKNMMKLAVFSLLAAALVVPAGQAFGQETKAKDKKAEKGEKAAKRQGPIPFHGKVGAVDKTAKTITVGERVFQVTSETVIKKADKHATLDAAVVGEEIRGNYKKSEDGKLVALTVNIGPKPEAGDAKKEGEAKKEGGKQKEKIKKEATTAE